MQTKDIICKKLDSIRNYLTPFLPLINSHVVSFISDNHWDNTVPENIKEEFSMKGFDNMMKLFWQYQDNTTSSSAAANSELALHFIEAQKMSLASLPDLCLSLSNLQTKFIATDSKEQKNVKISRLMSEKKSYEVDLMSQVVISMAAATNCSHIVDVGGGKAYLSSNLTLQHNLKVLSIDSSQGNTHGAALRLQKLERVWEIVKYKAENPNETKKGKNWKAKKKVPVVESHSNSEATGGAVENSSFNFKQKTEYLTSTSNMRKILYEAFPGENFSHVGLVGLHTCGNLAAAHIRLFAENLNVFKFLLNIGCCYHLLQEEFCEDVFWNEIKSCTEDKSDPAFPMSSYLRGQEYFLSRNPRMLACQSPERVLNERELPTEPLFFRSLLQVLLLKMSDGLDDFPKGIVGRLALKSKSFNDYARKAVKKLGLDDTFTDDELEDLYKSHEHYHDRIKIFFLLRVGLSPVLESLILLDRLLYLHEQGLDDSFIAQIFDPVKSPRCYAIVAVRNDDFLDRSR